MSRYAALYARLGYVFSDEALLQHALTHRSYGPEHNERLERHERHQRYEREWCRAARNE